MFEVWHVGLLKGTLDYRIDGVANSRGYQPAAESLQLQTTGKRLQEIHQENGKAPAQKVMINVCYYQGSK